jgi:hypothetical protein
LVFHAVLRIPERLAGILAVDPLAAVGDGQAEAFGAAKIARISETSRKRVRALDERGVAGKSTLEDAHEAFSIFWSRSAPRYTQGRRRAAAAQREVMMRVFADDGGSGGLSLLSGLLLTSVALVLLVLLVLMLIATLIVWRVYRRIRRWQAWHRGLAAIQSRAQRPGPGRDITRLRRDLREEVEAADVMLSRAKNGRLFTVDARALIDELKVNAAAVDADLASVQDYADVTQQRSALDGLGPQVARLIQTSYLARQTMLQTEVADRERRLRDLSGHVERQAAALKIYRQGTHGLDLGDPRGNLANSSDSQSRGPITDTSYPRGKSSASWGSARMG